MDFSILLLLFCPRFFGTFYLTVCIYICYNLYKEVIIIYTDINDIYTVKNADFFGEPYCYIYKDMRKIVLTKLSAYGRTILEKLLDLLDTNNEELIGTQAYRRIIYKNKSELAKMFNTSKQYMQKAIDNLTKYGIVKYRSGVLMVNPLVFSNSNLYDIRVLEEFNIKYLTFYK